MSRSTSPVQTGETTPLLSTTADSEMSVPSAASSSVPSILATSFRSPQGLLAQLGLAVSTLTLWKVLYTRPAGIFTYHPSLQSLSILLFFEGVLLLQPPPSNSTVKHKGLQLHQIFQLVSLVSILGGSTAIFYNKAIHGAKHFTSWHGKFGLATVSLIIVQIIFGALVVYVPSLFGGENRAKSLWKHHRISGYVTLTLLIITPALALWSDWLVGNSSKVERYLIGAGLVGALIGVLSRVQVSKLGIKRN